MSSLFYNYRPTIQGSLKLITREANHGFTLSTELSKGLKKVAGQYQSTLFMTLLSAYQTLLYRYTGQEDIRIGVPIANRHRSEVENVIGFFVNTQVLRGVINGRMPLSEVLQQAKITALGRTRAPRPTV